jgi:hypothetical protein
VFVYGASISGSALVLGGLTSSTKKIWPRRKEVEERKEFFEVIHGSQWSKAWISHMGRSGEKRDVHGLTVEKSMDLCFGQVQDDK